MEQIFENDYFTLYLNEKKVFIIVKREGYEMAAFNEEVLTHFKRLVITKFVALSSALSNVLDKPIEIGAFSEPIEFQFLEDRRIVMAQVKLSAEEFDNMDKDKLYGCIHKLINEYGIIYGVLNDGDMEVNPNNPFLIAEGDEPQDGEDAIINMYSVEDVHPKLEKEGGVDHYELNIINKVKRNDWLGERIEPTKGVDGKDVYGQPIKASNGKSESLKYDKKTVSEHFIAEENRTELRAINDGAVVYIKGLISVLNTIEVEGNVGFGTGNIEFDGFVDVEDSVEDNFSVKATENIQILGEMGIGAIESIESTQGDVFIKGGIAGRNKAVIKAAGNVFTKFASDCTIICENTVNIGFYAMNCNIKAKEVIFEDSNSKLIGGNVDAEIKVRVATIGCQSGTKTSVKVEGFDKSEMELEYDAVKKGIELVKLKINEYKELYEKISSDPTKSSEEKDKILDKSHQYKEKLRMLSNSLAYMKSYLRTKSDGEITASKKIYGNVEISLGDHTVLVRELKKYGASFVLKDGELVEDEA